MYSSSDTNVMEMTQNVPSVTLTPDPGFNYIAVNYSTSTVHVPTTVFDKCKFRFLCCLQYIYFNV